MGYRMKRSTSSKECSPAALAEALGQRGQAAREARIRALAERLPTLGEVKAERSRRARASLANFCKLVDDQYSTPAHLQRLLAELEDVERGKVRRLLVNMPPRHGKSLTTSKYFPAWYLGRNPDKRVIVACHTASLALGFSRIARNLLQDFGERVFGIRIADDSASVEEWNIRGKRGGLAAAGVGGPLTGKGADVLIIDDPIKDWASAFSSSQRDSIWDWYRTVARTRLAPGGAIIVVQTRWHEDDLTGRLRKHAEDLGQDWHEATMPMVDDAGAELPDFTNRDAWKRAVRGRILWESRYHPDEVAETREDVGSYAWEALYQQRPSSPEGEILKRDWWKYFTTDPARVREGVRLLKLDDLEIEVQSWDCAFKDLASSDFVVGGELGVLGSDRFLLDVVRDRMSFPATLAAIRAFRSKHPKAIATYVEDKANGPAVIATLDKEFPGIIPVNPEGGKIARARAVSPIAESGHVWLPEGAEWVSEFVEECAAFPRAKNDDQVDMLTQALYKVDTEMSELQKALALAAW